MRIRRFVGLAALAAVVVTGCGTRRGVLRPGGFLTVSVVDRTLQLVGTGAAESIVATMSSDATTLVIQYRRSGLLGARQTHSFTLDMFDRIDIRAGGGSDFVNIVDPNETLDRQGKVLHLDGGGGDNIVAISHQPLSRATFTRLRSLQMLARDLEALGNRAAGALQSALVADATKTTERVNVTVVAESEVIATEAQTELFVPATELLERKAPGVADLVDAVLARRDELTAEHERLAAELATELDPMNGEYPPDDDREPAREPSGREPDFESLPWATIPARTDRLEQEVLALAAEVEKTIGQIATEVELAATAIAERAALIEARSALLADTAEVLAADIERELSASADRVVSTAAGVRSQIARINDATAAVHDEIRRAVSIYAGRRQLERAGVEALSASDCTPPSTIQTYVGGDSFDLFFPIAAPLQSWRITGGGGFNVLFGGFEADDVSGGTDVDIIFGLGGDDHIHGGSGVDFLFGEFVIELPSQTGDDCIWGEDGLDMIAGDNGADPLSIGGTGGRDTLKGGEETDLVFGDDVLDTANDTLAGGSDRIEGNGGIDLVFGCGGADMIEGNDDIDLVVGNGGNDTLHGNDGRDVTISGTVIHVGNVMLGSAGGDGVHGGKGIDVMFGGGGEDALWGGEQVDIMFGGEHADVMRGEAGGVLFKIKGVDVRLGNVMFGGPRDDQMWGGGDLDVMFGQGEVDRMRGYDGNLQPLGIDADVMFGGDGNDTIEGDDESVELLNSTDLIFGGPGADEIRGGANADLLFGGADADRIEGDSNALTVSGSPDLIVGGPGNDTIDGGTSFDLCFGGDGADIIRGDNETPSLPTHDLIVGGPGGDFLNGGSSADVVLGGDGNDRILGDSDHVWQPLSHDFLFGGPGADEMNGGNGHDVMLGEAGCDRMVGDTGVALRRSSDFMFGGADDDSMQGGVSSDFMFGNDGHDTMAGDDGQAWQILSMDLMLGNAGCDTVAGGTATDFILGGSGVDRIDGEAGPDVLSGGAGGDTINGGGSLDIIRGDGGNDVIHGGRFLDTISGGGGDDCLYGDESIAFIVGGDGDDCLRGGNLPDILIGSPLPVPSLGGLLVGLLSAPDGDDRAFGERGADWVLGGRGDDALDGGRGRDLVWGGPGTDEVWGGPGRDRLFGETRHQRGSSGLDCECNTETCIGTVCITKFDDVNADGNRDSGEQGVGGWQFELACGCTTQIVTTDDRGVVCASFLSRICTVTEILQNGWIPTTPTSQAVSVDAGRTTSVVFGNRRERPEGRLCVHKFNDRNGNGVQDEGEEGMAGWTFEITVESRFTAKRVTTGPDGTGCITLLPVIYILEEELRDGWKSTTGATATATITAGETTTVTFGNQQWGRPPTGVICATKFEDLNLNGVQDEGEQVLSGWRFQRKRDGELVDEATTAADGRVCFGGRVATYTLEEVQQAGWKPTTPTSQIVQNRIDEIVEVRFGNVRQITH